MKSLVCKILCLVTAFIYLSASGLSAASLSEYEVKVDKFSELEVSSNFELTIERGMRYGVKIIVDAPYKNYVQCAVSSSVLSIYVDERKVPSEVKKLYSGRDIQPATFRAIVTMPSSSLTCLKLNDKASILEIDDVVSAESFKLVMNDNSKIASIACKTGSAELQMNNKASAEIEVDCQTLKLDANSNTSGKIKLKAKEAELNLNSNAGFDFDCDCQSITLVTKTTSKAVLNGRSSYVYFNLSGPSSVNAEKLECEDANVAMNSLCQLVEAASKTLTVNLSAGATLKYLNSPQINILNIRVSTMVPYEQGKE